jgi:hypothetical protein
MRKYLVLVGQSLLSLGGSIALVFLTGVLCKVIWLLFKSGWQLIN